uniref:Alpha N-terminal protein methyltransferase 1 n=1 Tax=Rhizophora mucronata TaxID=61149 RepID=A0A2P2KK53_RHIMU
MFPGTAYLSESRFISLLPAIPVLQSHLADESTSPPPPGLPAESDPHGDSGHRFRWPPVQESRRNVARTGRRYPQEVPVVPRRRFLLGRC